MADDAEKVAAAYFRAWRARDFTALRALLADEEFSYTGPLARLDDADVCRDSLARMASVTTDLVIRKTFKAGDDVMTWLDLHTTIAAPTAVANWMRVRDGRITDIQAVYDPRALLASADLPPGARGEQEPMGAEESSTRGKGNAR
ncbi:nuclear transport factor 2 family protein [Streptomyces cahuitamycinicus]|uniref:Nuclear transport factor 2 family protein n=1 Tax=Streptomyces cahuitamycinicus TaxID=2070367 RepID=A0A2N8TM26_9ACTN|nr:nuclear transport factor 2 family protein [Streptomyces cahuitamycinicus]PNG20023.1 nuclear transport factor 2 family protein [Streptomyces cahuitamycinicus]